MDRYEKDWAEAKAALWLEKALRDRHLWQHTDPRLWDLLVQGYITGWIDAKIDGELMRERPVRTNS